MTNRMPPASVLDLHRRPVLPRAVVAAASFAVALLLLAPSALAGKSDEVCTAKPLVVKIHADWCGTCKAMSSVWTRIGDEMGDQARIVELDVSDRVAFGESQTTAEELGIGEFFREYRSRTGTIAVLDCRSFEPVAVMNGERDIAKYREAIIQASRSS